MNNATHFGDLHNTSQCYLSGDIIGFSAYNCESVGPGGMIICTW